MTNYTTDLKTWGSKGVVYPDNYSYEAGEQPPDAWDNFTNYHLINDVKDHLIPLTNNRLDSGTGSGFPSNPTPGEQLWKVDSSELHVYDDNDTKWRQVLFTDGSTKREGTQDYDGHDIINVGNLYDETGDSLTDRFLDETGDTATGPLGVDYDGGGVRLESGNNGDVPVIRPHTNNYSGTDKDIEFGRPDADEWNIEGTPRAGGQIIATEPWVNDNHLRLDASNDPVTNDVDFGGNKLKDVRYVGRDDNSPFFSVLNENDLSLSDPRHDIDDRQVIAYLGDKKEITLGNKEVNFIKIRGDDEAGVSTPIRLTGTLHFEDSSGNKIAKLYQNGNFRISGEVRENTNF